MVRREQNFECYQGEDLTIEVTVYAGDKGADAYTAQNITGYALRARFAPIGTMRYKSDIDKTTADSEITITDGANGVCEIALAEADTEDMAPGKWEWSLWRIDSGSRKPLSVGIVTVLESAESRGSDE